jgi:hypothetical protein
MKNIPHIRICRHIIYENHLQQKTTRPPFGERVAIQKPIFTELLACAVNFNLRESIIVHYNDADLFINYPTKAKLLRIVRWEDSDVLADWEGSNGIGRSTHQYGLRVKLGADMDVSGPEVTIETSGEDFTSCSLIVESLAENAEASILKWVSNNLACDKIVGLNQTVCNVK